MSEAIEELRRLSEIDVELNTLRRRLKAGPDEVQQREEKVAALRDGLRESEREIREAALLADRCNLDVRTAEADIVEAEKRLNGIKNNTEYRIMTDKVKALKQALSDSENQGLTMMEKLDGLRAAHQEKVAAVETAEQELAALQAEVAREAEEIKNQGRQVQRRRQEQAERLRQLDIEAIDVYEEALKRGKGQALALLKEGICQTCFRRQSPNVENLVALGRSFRQCRCAGCGRLLYYASSPA